MFLCRTKYILKKFGNGSMENRWRIHDLDSLEKYVRYGTVDIFLIITAYNCTGIVPVL